MFNFNQISQDTEKRIKSAIDAMVSDFATFRTGRANPVILQKVMVNYYGSDVPISQVANINVPEARQIVISPFDKNMFGAIEKAILKSDLGLTPTNDGIAIRLIFPQMNEERRKELGKQVSVRAEQGCIAIRNIRRDSIESIKQAQKNKEISEDDLKGYENKIQKIIDQNIAQIHDLQKKKEFELMEI